MTNRPVYVAVIAWVLIAVAGLSILSVAAGLAVPSVRAGLEGGPLPFAATIAINIACSLLQLVCGLFILKGANWARLLYLAIAILSGAYLLLAGSVDSSLLLLWAVFTVLTLVGLFTPAASRFFAGGSARSEEPLSA